jgi:peptidoglycan/LPS O-acetylase OafA/YrhL
MPACHQIRSNFLKTASARSKFDIAQTANISAIRMQSKLHPSPETINMHQPTQSATTFDRSDKLGAVDALRGYAILLVLCAHTTAHIPGLIWPAKRLVLLGVYGVQLFFLASAVTLLMSWARSEKPFATRCKEFFIHRFLRIAPLYFLAIGFYWLTYGNSPKDFSVQVLAATLLFYNAWSPYLIPTVPGWQPVPGGWSIGVEFCFYFIFPLLAVGVTSLRRAVVFLVIGLIVMAAASTLGQAWYPELSAEQRANFLYFLPLNHLPVFALGFLLYHCLKSESIRQKVMTSRIDPNLASVLLLGAIVGLSLVGTRKAFDWQTAMPPTHILISISFVLWALVVLVKPGKLIVNPAIVALGRVSFSVYVLHFAMLKLTAMILEHVWPFAATGIASVAYWSAMIVIAGGLTFALSKLTYRAIEKPFIDLGKRLTRRAPVAAPAVATRA